jgi:hypothetical protein
MTAAAFLLGALIPAIVLGYPLHRRTIERDTARGALATARENHATAIDNWRHDYRQIFAAWEKSQEDELDALATINELRDDLAIEQGRRVAAELNVDLHFLMPTIHGTRAGLGNVVEIDRKRGRA